MDFGVSSVEALVHLQEKFWEGRHTAFRSAPLPLLSGQLEVGLYGFEMLVARPLFFFHFLNFADLLLQFRGVPGKNGRDDAVTMGLAEVMG